MSRKVAQPRTRPHDSQRLWIVSLEVPQSARAAFDDAFAEIGDTSTCFESAEDGSRWRFEAYLDGAEPARAGVVAIVARAAARARIKPPEIVIEALRARDWLADNRIRFPPISVGRFFIHGSYFEGRVPPGRIGIALDAGLAFGSGTHESTRGCLLALDALGRRRRFLRPLDLGTGSGILAIAMARVWRVEIVAADIDPVAVAVAAANARRNRVATWVDAIVSDGLAVGALARRAPYDLIVANILARPLERLAPRVANSLAQGGRIILSGILTEQAAGVLAAYRTQGLALKRRLDLGLWTTLVIG